MTLRDFDIHFDLLHEWNETAQFHATDSIFWVNDRGCYVVSKVTIVEPECDPMPCMIYATYDRDGELVGLRIDDAKGSHVLIQPQENPHA